MRSRRVLRGVIDRRVALWSGLVSAEAATDSFLVFVWILVGYLLALLTMVVGCSVIVFGSGVVGAAIVIAGLVVVLAAFSRALLLARRAGRDVARQYGLPENSWRSIRFKTPDQFKEWLSGRHPNPQP